MLAIFELAKIHLQFMTLQAKVLAKTDRAEVLSEQIYKLLGRNLLDIRLSVLTS